MTEPWRPKSKLIGLFLMLDQIAQGALGEAIGEALGEPPLDQQPRPPLPTAPPCITCGKPPKFRAITGECSHCGVYVCKTCKGLHIGPGEQACPGQGVPIPASAQYEPPRVR